MSSKGFLKNKDGTILPITRGELVLDSEGKPALRSRVFLASSEEHGLMSSEDKNKLDALAKPFKLGVDNVQDHYIYTGMEEIVVKLLSGNNITLNKSDSGITVNSLDEKVKQKTVNVNQDYSVLFANNSESDVTGYTYKSSKLLYNPSTQTLTVPKIDSIVSIAECIYTNGSSIGSSNNPVYVNSGGKIVPCSTTIGSAQKPVYVNNGIITPITIPATTNHVYLMGIDNSNNMYTGTQTAEGVKLVGGNKLYAYQGFFESSDARLKNFKGDIIVDLDKLCKLPKKYFTWKSDSTNKLHLGTSAQELQKLYPELVESDDNGFLQVSYEKLSIIALSAIDALYQRGAVLEANNSKLEERIKQLEQIIYGKS